MNSCVFRYLGVIVVVTSLTSIVYANAPAGRYTIANGTVYDSKTQLTWQQTVTLTTYAWADAQTYCTGLGWRLPTYKELVSIVDYSRANPAIDPTAFPTVPTSYTYWSASSYAGSLSPGALPQAWYVSFANGYASVDNVSVLYRVRCVR